MMVVLAASIIGKQFVDMARIRIEGLLAAFLKLVGTGKQHTFVEMESVCYQSNILEDLETLKLLSKLVSAQVHLICFFAFDEAISLGNKENATVTQVRQYCEMESHDFGLSTDTESLSSKTKGRPPTMLLLKVLV
ncbi:unnamed protein product [Spirodela intermedia]|uniref:Coatomer subunit delta n=2 Tax=Spirodela intermedia TaxID=51605 RepID=A0A7I8KUN5_SPIIN|nr:unnamed protein product [Spirodela intermedia]CAA6664156.1 unnamed protein product [Spirodela intermedia]CAA7400694.1 unnamed protein product [Spirodela intermedia]